MRKALIIAGVMVLAAMVIVFGTAWYFSGKVLAIESRELPTVTVVDSDVSSITLGANELSMSAGQFGLRWPGGSAVSDGVISTDGKTVKRGLVEVKGTVPSAGAVAWNRNVWEGNPEQSLHIGFQDVNVVSGLGDMPAWFVPGPSSTWVIAVHGRGDDRSAALRVLPVVKDAGMPMLVTTYRNDVGAPRSPDGKDHLGDTEWEDVDAAISYARQHGAQRVVLCGWSKGGAMVLTALHRSSQAEVISGVVLDAPVVDWRSTLKLQAKKRHVPSPVGGLAMWMVEQRGGLDLDDFSQAPEAAEIQVPVLLLQGNADETVPVAAAKKFAASNPRRIQLELFPTAQHTAEWNADETRYEQLVSQFLQPLGSS